MWKNIKMKVIDYDTVLLLNQENKFASGPVVQSFSAF